MSYQVIALDLDGTLLDSEKKILPESLVAIKQASLKGIKVIIVTGRHHIAIHPFYQLLDLYTPVICCNGVYIYNYHAKKILDSDPLSIEDANNLIDYLDSININYSIYADDVILYEKYSETIEKTIQWSNSLPKNQRPNIYKINNSKIAIKEVTSIWKFSICTSNIEKLRIFSKNIKEYIEYNCEWVWFDQIDISKKGNNKGLRLQRWVESQGLSMKNVIAFGDNFNDISMLSAVGLGIAMGNSCDEVKKYAKVIIDENNIPGIAKAIYKYIL